MVQTKSAATPIMPYLTKQKQLLRSLTAEQWQTLSKAMPSFTAAAAFDRFLEQLIKPVD
ncbi:MAG: hypothetical protein F6J97_11615 [Leptolyngbya sp. SIO4C1]|nr:hypothetical protein [Leptolyngbya sp. SIO4C1]